MVKELTKPEAAAKEPKVKKPAKEHETISGVPLKRVYGPEDLKDWKYDEALADPGQFPYTRGIHEDMYRGKVWTMRQFAGFGGPEETNQRFRYLLSQGQTGLSTAFDLPTLMGYDSDHPKAHGEVGVCGVAIDSLEDIEILYKDLPLDKVSTSMTINGPAVIIYAMFLANAKKRGIDWKTLNGTLQNDIFKEYIAQKTYLIPPRPALKLIQDMMVFCTHNVPRWNTISVSGYHIREAGATAVQELAFTLADGFAYVDAGIEAGLQVDDFVPRLSFFFNAHIDFFEEIAKYRAARRIWAKRMRDHYGAKDERSLKLRFHTQTAGCSLTAPQPENNIIRTAIEALAGVLGGTQSLHTNSMDEVLGLPTEKAAHIALRTQQIIAYETGVTNVVDPLAGSYFVEWLTDEMERGANQYFKQIDEIGGVIAGIEKGFFMKEIADSAYRFEQKMQSGDRTFVGLTGFKEEAPGSKIEILKIGGEYEARQRERIKSIKERRDQEKVTNTLEALKTAMRTGENAFPHLIEAVESYATLGEICDAMREVWGAYRETAVL
ncbi:MAG TPA: methylmalonyl-CoA mutase family protein [Candidatus Obscuribacter sp.]|nr:methylmalonyl-CoA mutase family protein [Candidatus Obscuribacter sp.]HNH73484.1 methylmalonyl-CoA mutase family protein [Candidatus Obscuribacter sp.]HNN62524.1 methylmalonyl-CoA mutase family protein [Candidatus Obscuribacter sp.]